MRYVRFGVCKLLRDAPESTRQVYEAARKHGVAGIFIAKIRGIYKKTMDYADSAWK